jgi:PBP1b-binding outer membrane lipoprotein LpoB
MKGVNMKRIALIIIFSLILCSCTPSEEAIQTAIALTQKADPTITETPTLVNTSTETVTITSTITPTSTETLTPTITSTETATLSPYLQTATGLAINAQKTASAKAVKATETAKTATYLDSFEKVYWKDFITYPENYKGKRITLSCRIFNIVDNSVIQCYADGTYEAFYVEMTKSFSGLYEHDMISIYGTGGGEKCFDNAYGATICQPLITNSFFLK